MQLALPEEIKTDSSTAKRSQVTGHLLLTMPKVERKANFRYAFFHIPNAFVNQVEFIY